MLIIREMLANEANKENETGQDNETSDRQSKLSSSEPNSVLEIRNDHLNSAQLTSNELFKPILKRKVNLPDAFLLVFRITIVCEIFKH